MMKVWTALLVCGAAVSVVVWAVALLRENGVCPFAAVTRFVRGLPLGGRLAVLPLFAALVVYGSVKNHSNERGEMSNEIGSESGFNRVDRADRVDGCESVFNAENAEAQEAQRGDLDNVANVEMLPIANTNSQLGNGEWVTGNGSDLNNSHLSSPIAHISSLITEGDCEAGFVLSGVGYGEEFDFAPPENAVVCEDWLRFGAHEDWIYIGPGAWSSRFGSNFVETVRVFSCGGIDFFPEGHISLLNNPISIAPAANWHLLSVSNSMFWHAETPSNTLVLTWQNALLNRRADSPVNIQAELFPSGGMRITHNLSGETVAVTEYLPAPQLPLHVSLDEVKGRFADGNTNAYYYADVVVEKGPSIVTVRCDAETALGDYAVAAYPGETNRLPFLIGPQYEVESEAAFAHFGVADCEVIKTNFTDRIVGLQWPVEISFEEGYAGSGKMFEMSVVPNFLKGSVFVGDGRGRSRAAGCPCGCDVDTNGVVRISEACNCDPCTISGSYGYEGYSEEFEFNYYPEEDGEDWDPDNPEDPGEPPEESKPSATIWFDKSAVIFEDEYENEPGVVVPRRSTRVKLTCCAYGGELGGNFTVDLSGMGALKLVSGTPPSSRTIAPYETVTFEAEYEAEKASSHEKGTVAKAKIIEKDTNLICDTEDKMTVVKVTISPMKIARDNMLPGRHKLGVCEVVSCRQEPNMPLVTWDAEHGFFYNEGLSIYYSCPLYSLINPVKAKVDEVELIPDIQIVEPQDIVALNTTFKDYGIHPGVAGYVGMELDVYISPFDVSFEEIDIEEVPNERGSHIGFFASPNFSNIWYHTSLNGAGNWINVGEDNYFARDLAAYTGAIPKVYLTGLDGMNTLGWYYGYISWDVPFGWRRKKTGGKYDLPYKQFAHDTEQEFVLEDDGTLLIRKLGSWVSRSTNEVIMIYGAD